MTLSPLINKLLSEYFRWTAGFVALLVLTGGYFFFLSAKISVIQNEAFNDRAKVVAQLKSDQQYADALERSRTDFRRLFTEEKLKQIDDFVPSDSDFPGLLLTIQNIAQTANLQLDNISLGQIVDSVDESESDPAKAATQAEAASSAPSGIRRQDVTVSVSGGTGYDNFKRFIGLLESSRRLFDVISLNFHQPSAGDSGEGGSVPYSVVLRTYYLPASPTP